MDLGGAPAPRVGVATRYDKLATPFLATAMIAAAIIYWCN